MTTSEYTPPQGTQPTAPPPADAPQPASPAPEPEPAGGRMRRGPRSLLAKLTIGVVSLVVLLVLIIGTATYVSLRSFLYSRLDGQLNTIAEANAGRIAGCFRASQPSCYLGDGPRAYKAPETEWVAVLYPSGQRSVEIRENDSFKAIELSAAERDSVGNDPKPLRTVRTQDGQDLRITARVVDSPYGQYVVATGLSVSELNGTLRTYVGRAILIGSAAVVLALIATSFGVRFSLRRLRRVTMTAEDVAKELSPEGAGLDRRVPDDEPDTEVGQLATSFNTMLAAVETQFAARVESEQRMRQFLADASHELRTPLTSIRGYAELARMQRAMGDASEDNLDRIEFEGTRMSRLVEDLLLLARGDGNDDRPMQAQLIDIAGLVDDAVSGARAAFPHREIVIGEVDPDAHVVGDPDQLLRVVRNLVTNAAVHTAPEHPIEVSGTAYEYGVTIQVVDGGPGLAPEDAAHVFERFWRADKARTRARGGSGLGMSIVASIVRRHGGTVRFDSTVENGSTVTVWLPGVQPG